MEKNTRDKLIEKALEYSDKFFVLPAHSQKKRPLFSWSEYQTKRPTKEDIIQLFEAYKNHNGICALTGKHSGYLVIDVDPGSDLTPDDFPPTLTAITGRKGFHLYYKYPQNVEIKSVTAWKEHVDIRANGAIVIMPPSIHMNGNEYQWVDETVPMAELPQSLIDDLPKDGVGREKMDPSTFNTPVEEGQRHDTLLKIAGKLFQQTPEDDWLNIIYPYMESFNNQYCNPPLSKKELDSIYYGIAKSEKASRESKSSGSGGKINTTALLLNTLYEQTELIFNQFGQPCYRLVNKPYVEQLPSSSLNRRLQFDFYQETSLTASNESIKSAIDIYLAGVELDNPKRVTTHTRVGIHEDALFYDMGNGSDFVKITKNGWELVDSSPIIFEHQQNQLEQVVPIKGGSLIDFLKLINITDKDDQLLLLVYMVCSLVPNIPRPILVCHGVQGSSKTTTLRLTRALIDPAKPDIVSPPKGKNDMVQLASHNYCLILDNMSNLLEWQSDALCRFVTGDGYGKRALWTNDKDFLYSFMRVIGISGINQIATKPDLLDRSLLIEFERVSPERRKTEQKLWSEFEIAKPGLFGALLDTLAKTLSLVDEVQVKQPIRLADFHQYATAAALALGYSQMDLDRALQKNILRQNQEALTASAVAQSIIKFMEGKTEFTASSTEAYNQIKEVADSIGVTKDYPKSVTWFWRSIEPVEHNLKEVGITCKLSSTTAHSKITIKNCGSHVSTEPEEDDSILDFTTDETFEEQDS